MRLKLTGKNTKWFHAVLLAGVGAASVAQASPTVQELEGKIDNLQKQIDTMKDTSSDSVFEVSGDYQFRIDYMDAKFSAQNAMWKMMLNMDDITADMNTSLMNMAIPMVIAEGNSPNIVNIQNKTMQILQGMSSQQIMQMFGQYMNINEHKARNDSLFTNRVRLNFNAHAAKDVEFKGRVNMYKIWGMTSSDPLSGAGMLFPMNSSSMLFDGNSGHTPSDDTFRLDRAYVNWNKPADLPMWISIGRRPTTGGAPAHIRQGLDFNDRQATPASLGIDYAFDGATVGFFTKDYLPFKGGKFRFCYGKGFESGFDNVEGQAGLDDALFYGISWDIINDKKNKIFANLQSFRADELPDSMNLSATNNLGDIHQTTFVFMNQVNEVDWFLSGAWSHAMPSKFTNSMSSMLSSDMFNLLTSKGISLESSILTNPGEALTSHDGYALYAGVRIPVGNSGRLGFEYNWGSKYWVSFTPAADDDLLNAKAGTRGQVGEVYYVWDLPVKELLRDVSKVFVRFGYQHYDYDYTGSGSYLGAPVKISDLDQPGVMTLLPSPKTMNQAYFSFNVFF